MKTVQKSDFPKKLIFRKIVKKIKNMNFSISALRILSTSNSPFITAAHSRGYSFQSFKNIFAKNLFSNFYRSSAERNILLTQSRFSKSLGPVVKVSSIGFSNSTRYNRISGEDGGQIEISCCTFYLINTLGNRGGALELKYNQLKTSEIKLISNGFYSCKSDKRGGAFYLIPSVLTAKGNCFTKCVSGDTSMVGYVEGNKLSAISFNHTTSTLCAPQVTQGNKDNICLSMGTQIVFHNNFTGNQLSRSYPAFNMGPFGGSISGYLTVHSCVAESLLIFLSAKANTITVTNSLLINNTISNDLADIMNGNVTVESMITYLSKTPHNTLNVSVSYCSTEFRNCMTDLVLIFETASGGKNLTIDCSVINDKRFAPVTHEYIETRACWANYIEKPKTIIEFVLQWKRTLLLSAMLVACVALALIGKRLYQNFTISKKTANLNDTERIVGNNNGADINFEYDFDMI